MTQYIDVVRRIRAVEEPAGAFGTEVAIGSFVDVLAVEDSVKLMLNSPFESPGLLQQDIHGMNSKVRLPESAQLDFTTNLSAATTRSGSGGAHTGLSQVPGWYLWRVATGSTGKGNNSSTVASAASASAITLTSASGYTEGDHVAFPTGTGGALEVRSVKTVSTNTITLSRELSATPTNGMVCYSAYTFYLNDKDGSNVKSLQVAMEGAGTTDRFLLSGGQIAAPPSFELNPGTIPKVKWSWQFAAWAKANGTETTMNLNAALADAALSDAGINAVMDSEFRVATSTSVTLAGSLYHPSQINIAPQISYIPHRTPSGLNTIKQWVPNRAGPAVTGDFLLPYEDTTWLDRRDAETELRITYQIGSTVTGGAVLIELPRVVIDNVQRETMDGIAGQRVSFFARLDASTTTNTTTLQKSPFRISMF